MTNSKQMRELARNPAAYMRFQATGALPEMIRPQSPLISLLEKISPRDCGRIMGLRVDSSLGYSGSRQFHTAAQALRWIRPDREMLRSKNFPAESWRIKGFHQSLYIEDLVESCASFPEDLVRHYAHLRRPAAQTPPTPRDRDAER